MAGEARVFPLLELGARKSRHVEAVGARLTAAGYSVTVETVSYEFQRGGNQMMRITTPLCSVEAPSGHSQGSPAGP